MSSLADHATDYSVVERERPEQLARNLRVAAHLWSSAVVFFFIAFLFAYFYLRSLNQNRLWHPHAVKAPVTLGTLIAIAMAASAAAVLVGARRLHAGRERDWLALGGAGFGLGVLVVVLQIVEWSTIGFGPTNGGFASVFLGWTGLYLLFVVCSLYWLETLLATTFRYRGDAGHEPGHASGDSHRTADDVAEPLSLVAPGASAFGFYWAVLAGIGVIAWIVLYLL
jgi:heme/copper-type cytochrome/quinol oxidase subunit 3